MPNAIELLTKDHENVRAMLEKLVEPDNSGNQREKLLENVKKELDIHTQIEEEIFYPAFADKDSGEKKKQLYFEAYEEHRAVKKLVIPDLKEADLNSMQFLGRAKVLKEMVEHHIEEEESEMFKLAEESMSKDELQELGDKLAARKKELQ